MNTATADDSRHEAEEQQQPQQEQLEIKRKLAAISNTNANDDDDEKGAHEEEGPKQKVQKVQVNVQYKNEASTDNNHGINSNENTQEEDKKPPGRKTVVIVADLQKVIRCLEGITIDTATTAINDMVAVEDDEHLKKLAIAVEQLIANTEYKTVIPPNLFTRLCKEWFKKITNEFDSKISTLNEVIKELERRQEEAAIANENDREQIRILKYENKIRSYDKKITAYKEEITAYKEEINLYIDDGNTKKQDGYYFLSVEKLFDAIPLSDVNNKKTTSKEALIDTFNREDRDHVVTVKQKGKSESVEGKYYEATLKAAFFDDPSNGVAADQDRSTSSTKTGSDVVDIFGNKGSKQWLPSAHLMPHAKNCASHWYVIVPWVLHMLDKMWKTKISKKRGKKKGKNETSQLKTLTKKKWDAYQKCIHGSLCNKQRIPTTGIKHFLTNRIRLHDQKMYYDDNPCLLVIPILSKERVRSWHGEEYSAIVVAGSHEKTSANRVYERVGAVSSDPVESILATVNEVHEATLLLSSFIQCFCEALESFSNEFIQLVQDNLYNIATQSMRSATADTIKKELIQIKEYVEKTSGTNVATELDSFRRKYKFNNFKEEVRNQMESERDETFKGMLKTALDEMICEKIPFEKFMCPVLNMLNVVCLKDSYVAVRKVTFCSFGDSINAEQLHTAPDPILLLAKAASNWFKRHYLEILPACGEGSDEEFQECTVEEECNARGWALPNKKPCTDAPCIEALLINDHDVARLIDEDLTDDEK